MNLREARIGYGGYSRNFSGPGDRRRFAAYARMKGISFERAELSGDYDIVLVTHNGDIAGWTARKRREGSRLKFVFELADSYLSRTGAVRHHLKGAARYALGVDSRLSPNFMATLMAACEAADAVICSTDEQAAAIGRYNPRVFTSFDYFEDDLGPPKSDYSRGEKLRLVWEGQATTLDNIQSIRTVLNDLRDRIELHVVTDPVNHRYLGRYFKHPSQDLLRGIECDIVFHPWEVVSFSRHIVAADAAIIPIEPTNAFARGKPENKLVMMWQLGMPAVTSDTPAYVRAMHAAQIDLLCAGPSDWQTRLEKLIAAEPEELEALGRKGRAFAEWAYSKDEFLARFDAALGAVGFSTD